MRQTFIQTGKITRKERVRTSEERHHFTYGIKETISKFFKIAAYVSGITISLLINKGVFAQEKFAYAGKEKGGYTQEVKKVSIIKEYTYTEGKTPEKLIKKMKDDGLEPKIIFPGRNDPYPYIVAENHPYIYIYLPNPETNKTELWFVKIVRNPDPTRPIKIHYIEDNQNSRCFSLITSNGNGPELKRTLFDKEPITLSPEINPILEEVGSPNNLRVYSRMFKLTDKNGNREFSCFSYVFGFNEDGSLSKNAVMVALDGERVLGTMEELQQAHLTRPIRFPSIQELQKLVPIKPKADVGTSSQTAK